LFRKSLSGVSSLRHDLRASVGSTEAAKDVVARFGGIDRSHLESIDFGGVGPMCYREVSELDRCPQDSAATSRAID
jgi:hypothetical protein